MSKPPLPVAVSVCGVPSWLVTVILAPGATVSSAGVKVKSRMTTVVTVAAVEAPADGLAEAEAVRKRRRWPWRSGKPTGWPSRGGRGGRRTGPAPAVLVVRAARRPEQQHGHGHGRGAPTGTAGW
ncbi:hypothetical protein GCM10020229_47150 [Kitasatospora albolonga]|uniref:hypothetical protein n=1 Tax=Kitasatospora albolonga TaxID=68173 RepID=UPI0031F0C3DC